MASQLETAIARFRANLLAHDEATLKEVTSSYVEVRATLLKRIERLTVELESEDAPSVSELMQWDRAKELLTQTEKEMAKLGLSVRPTVFSAKAEAVRMGSEYAQSMAGTVVRDPATAAQIETAWNRLNTPAAEAIVGRMSDGAPLTSWFGQFGPDAGSRMAQALRTAAALGTNPRGVAAMLEKQVDVSGARLLAMARTETLGAYRDATLRNYLENADILDGWQWLAAKQTRTCLCCIALDGQEFPLTTTFQPSHVNCRCSSIPIVSGEPPRQRQTASEWFEAQPDSVKHQMIPATAWDDYKAGKLELQDFVYLDKNKVWGDRYREGSVSYAKAQAKKRGDASPSIPEIESAPKAAPKPPPASTTAPAPPTPSATAPTVAPVTTPNQSLQERATSIIERAAREQKPPQTVAMNQTATPIEIPQPLPPAHPPVTASAVELQPAPTADQIFDGNYPDYRGSLSITDGDLSDAEFKAVKGYARDDYEAINEALRSGRPLLSTRTIDEIDRVIARSATTVDLTVYRGVLDEQVVRDLKNGVGMVMTDGGFLSTSTDRLAATEFATNQLGEKGGAVLRMRVPAGSNAVDINALFPRSVEREMLLPRGTSYRVVSVDESVEPMLIDVELV